MDGNSISENRNAERLTAACILSVAGGYLDIYTYLFRGGVFANAVTGNMVLFGCSLAEWDWRRALHCLCAIVFYALGIFVTELIHARLAGRRRLSWQQSVILLELVCLIPMPFLPHGEWDFAVNAMIAFVCALQVQTFRRVRGLPFASTMCTGNLRSGTEALFRLKVHGESGEFFKACHYYGIIGCFIGGAALGAILLPRFGASMLLLAPAGLLTVFCLITPPRGWVRLQRRFNRLFRRRTAPRA